MGRFFQGSVPQTPTLELLDGFPSPTSLSSLFSCAVRWERDLARNWQWMQKLTPEPISTSELLGADRGIFLEPIHIY